MSEGAPVVQAAPEPMEQQVETPLQANAEEKAANGANEEATVPEQSAEPSTEADGEPEDVDAELEAMKLRLQEMEAASMGMKDGAVDPPAASAVAATADGNAAPSPARPATAPAAPASGAPGAHIMVDPEDAVADADARSIYVGNVDYSATVEELGAYFADCGTINRVTIMCNKHTGQPKGFAYIEFEDQDAVKNATILNDSQFRSRPLKVVPKRTNVPGVNRGGYRGRPRFSRGGRGYGYGRRPRRGMRGRWAPY